MPFGDSRQIEVGDFVFAIGYPANIGQSVTSGTVSGLHRSNIGIEEFENFIQTDDERTARIHRIVAASGAGASAPIRRS
jgi:S1-C subfamily serine protease